MTDRPKDKPAEPKPDENLPDDIERIPGGPKPLPADGGGTGNPPHHSAPPR